MDISLKIKMLANSVKIKFDLLKMINFLFFLFVLNTTWFFICNGCYGIICMGKSLYFFKHIWWLTIGALFLLFNIIWALQLWISLLFIYVIKIWTCLILVMFEFIAWPTSTQTRYKYNNRISWGIPYNTTKPLLE